MTWHLRSLVTAAATLLLSTTAAAQVQWTATVRPGEVELTDGLTDESANPVPKDGTATLSLTCEGGADCTRVIVELQKGSGAATLIPATRKDANSATFEVQGADISTGGTATTLLIRLGTDVSTFTLEQADPNVQTPGDKPTTNGNARNSETPISTLLARDCRRTIAGIVGSFHDGPRDYAQIVVTPIGNVLRRPGPVIDESDSVKVTVVAARELIPRLAIRRLSPIRTLGEVRFIGQGTDIPRIVRTAGGVGAPPCDTLSMVLHDFAHGKGEVEIRVLTGKSGADEITERVGTFEFNVNPLYSGAFSLGAMRTELEAPEFGLREEDSDTVIFIRNKEPGYRVKYLVMYTHFIWGKRDVEELPGWNEFYKRINPSMGVVLDDIPNNWVGGLTADLFEGVYISGGAHFGRVKRLDTDSGLEVGDRFSGEESDIPIQTQWRVRPFFSIGVDVRAAAELLRMALTGSGKS